LANSLDSRRYLDQRGVRTIKHTIDNPEIRLGCKSHGRQRGSTCVRSRGSEACPDDSEYDSEAYE
jgi:hypothetical protein